MSRPWYLDASEADAYEPEYDFDPRDEYPTVTDIDFIPFTELAAGEPF